MASLRVLLLLSLFCVAALGSDLSVVAPQRELQQSVSETSHNSWADEIESSLYGFIFGAFIFILAFPCLTFAEGTAVHREKCLDYARQILKTNEAQKGTIADAESAQLLPSHDAQLRHVTGFVHTETGKGELSDPLFAQSSERALVLQREVSMYQYVERTSTSTKKDNFGGGSETKTNYTLHKEWSTTHQTLEHLPYTNPSFPVEKERFESKDIIIREGDTEEAALKNVQLRYLSPSQTSQLDLSSKLPFTLQGLAKIPASSLKLLLGHSQGASKDCLTVTATGDLLIRRNGKSTLADEIGDLKVSYRVSKFALYSLLAEDVPEKRTFQAFEVTKFGEYKVPFLCGGCCVGPVAMVMKMLESMASHTTNVINLFELGIVSGDALLDHALTANQMYLSVMRLVTFIMFVLGFYLMLDPVATLVQVVGFLGSIVRVGELLAALTVGTVCYLLTSAIAWMVYHPLRGVTLLMVAGGIIFGVHYYSVTYGAAAVGHH